MTKKERLNILYVGNFRPTFSTESHIAATLEEMGHFVTRLQEDEMSPADLTAFIKKTVRNCKNKWELPDLFLFTRTWGNTVTHDHLNMLRRFKVPSVSYHLDLYVGLKRDGGIDTDPFWRTDYVFTPDGSEEAAAVFKKKGINHIYQWPGVYGKECYIKDVPQSRDLIFVGSYNYHPEWPYRGQLINWLKRSYRNRFQLWGATESTKVRGDALNDLYSSTKITVGDTLCLGFTRPEYWSDRVFETTGRGGFLIHPRIRGLEHCFEEGKEIVFYDYQDFKGLADKIAYYYSHDDEREAIRLAGHERTKREHTYTQRMERMFKKIGL